MVDFFNFLKIYLNILLYAPNKRTYMIHQIIHQVY